MASWKLYEQDRHRVTPKVPERTAIIRHELKYMISCFLCAYVQSSAEMIQPVGSAPWWRQVRIDHLRQYSRPSRFTDQDNAARSGVMRGCIGSQASSHRVSRGCTVTRAVKSLLRCWSRVAVRGEVTVNFKFTSPRRCDAFAIFSRDAGNTQVPAKLFSQHEMAKCTRPLL